MKIMKTLKMLDKFVYAGLILLLFPLVGCSQSSLYISTDKSLTIPVTDSSLVTPGLKMRYYKGKYQHITDMPKGNQLPEFGIEGDLVAKLDNVYSKEGDVFGTGRSMLTGFWFRGLVHLEKPGVYFFQALANDGIRFFLNEQMLFEDPFKHSDRLSPVGQFTVEKPGWYPLQILYFQRKGTSALRLYWKQPDQERFTIVPAEALGHRRS